ncbi:MAG TPA: MerR family transcriptional regulator [Polyangiaceae bacterium]
MIAVPMTTPPAEAERPEFTIDELAAAARVPSRTIRFYQSRGALMAPEIRGRVAYYGQAHVDRLKLIAQLQDRGLRIDAIRDVLASIDRGELDLAEWLGVEQQVQTPWANDQPRTVTEEELYEIAGTRRPGLLADLARTRLVERHGEVYLVRSPALLSIAMKLEAAGIALETAAAASALVRKHVGRAAGDLVDLFVKRADEGELDPADLGTVFQALRPLGLEAVRIIFGPAMERELRHLYESGRMARLPGRARRAKAKKKRR